MARWRAAFVGLVVLRAVLCAGILAMTGVVGAQSDPDPLRAFLRGSLGFTARDIRNMDGGQAIARIVDTKVRQEVAVFGIVWIDVPKEFFIEQYRNIEAFEGGTDRVPQIGRFSDPPALEDLARLTLDEDDLKALPRCRPGDCNLKLPAAAMARFRSEVAWSKPEASGQANQLARQMLLELVQAYQKGGNIGLGSYQDHERPVRVAQEFQAMLQNDSSSFAHVPGLWDYLNGYPASQLAGGEDFFYWSKVSFGLKPTIRANHVTIYRVPGSQWVAYALASKQLYSSHYFNTALELRLLVDDPQRAESTGFFLLNMNRSRSDGLTGFSGRVIRSTILSRTRDGMTAYLRRSKQTLEERFKRMVR